MRGDGEDVRFKGVRRRKRRRRRERRDRRRRESLLNYSAPPVCVS